MNRKRPHEHARHLKNGRVVPVNRGIQNIRMEREDEIGGMIGLADIAREEISSPETQERFMRFFPMAFKNERFHYYAKEWAQRFNKGSEYFASDFDRLKVLHSIDRPSSSNPVHTETMDWGSTRYQDLGFDTKNDAETYAKALEAKGYKIIEISYDRPEGAKWVIEYRKI